MQRALAGRRGLRALLPRAWASAPTTSSRSRRARSATRRNQAGVPRARRARDRPRRSACSPSEEEALLRLPRRGELDDARRRRRARPRRRLAAARRGPRAATPAALGSWPLGAVRMTEHFLPDGDDRRRKKQRKALRAHVVETLERDAPWLPRAGRPARRHRRHGAQPRGRRPGRGRPAVVGVQGFVDHARARSTTLDRRARRAARRPSAATIPGIKSARADLILAGAIVVQTVLEVGGFDAIEVTEAGLREGVFFELATSPATRRCSTTCAARAC